MRLYARLGQSSVVHEDYDEPFDVEDGAVEVPDTLGAHLHATHIGGKPAWETEAERHHRLIAEEIERRRDPAAMYELMQQLVDKSTPAADAESTSEPDAADPLGGLTVAQLKDHATEHGIDIGAATKKADILAAITKASAGGGE